MSAVQDPPLQSPHRTVAVLGDHRGRAQVSAVLDGAGVGATHRRPDQIGDLPAHAITVLAVEGRPLDVLEGLDEVRVIEGAGAGVLLVDVLEYSVDESAQILGSTPPAVKAALHRGRNSLKRVSDESNSSQEDLSSEELARLRAYAERSSA